MQLQDVRVLVKMLQFAGSRLSYGLCVVCIYVALRTKNAPDFQIGFSRQKSVKRRVGKYNLFLSYFTWLRRREKVSIRFTKNPRRLFYTKKEETVAKELIERHGVNRLSKFLANFIAHLSLAQRVVVVPMVLFSFKTLFPIKNLQFWVDFWISTRLGLLKKLHCFALIYFKYSAANKLDRLSTLIQTCFSASIWSL